jgi:hypothetical protein
MRPSMQTILRHTLFLILLSIALPALMLAQDEEFVNPVCVSSHWKLIQNDSIKILQDSLSHRIDTVLVDSYDEQDHEAYHVVSIVGSLLSYDFDYAMFGGAHPTGGRWYRTIDVNTKEEISLEDLFSSTAILAAITRDTNFTKHTIIKNPKDIHEFVSSLVGACEVDFSKLLVSYAIKSIDHDVVLIEFGLNHGCELMPEKFTTIDVVLPKSAMLYDFITD